MKATELVERIQEMIKAHGDHDIAVMQEVEIPEGVTGILQTNSLVTDVAASSSYITVIGQELL